MQNFDTSLDFETIRKQFHQLSCPECGCSFEEDKIKLFKESSNYILVKAKCSICEKTSMALLFDSHTILAPNNNTAKKNKTEDKKNRKTRPLNLDF